MKPAVMPFGDGVVRLRLLDRGDLPVTLEWRNDEGSRKWFRMSERIAPIEHERWFDGYASEPNDFVFMLELAGSLVGQLSVYGINVQAGTAEVGRFLTCPSARRHGYMSRGCVCLIDWCRSTMGLRELHLEVRADNVAAIRLYKKLGFAERNEICGFIGMSLDLSQWQTRGR